MHAREEEEEDPHNEMVSPTINAAHLWCSIKSAALCTGVEH